MKHPFRHLGHDSSSVAKHYISKYLSDVFSNELHTVFPHIVSSETILFWIFEFVGNSNIYQIGWIFAAETIWGSTVSKLFVL